MSTFTIFIAPPNQRRILSAMLDLSSAGYLLPCVWWESSQNPLEAPDRANPTLLYIAHGKVQPVTLQQIMTQHGLKLLRMVLLVPIGNEEYVALPRHAETYFHDIQITGGVEAHRMRVLIPYGDAYDENACGRAGWYDYMLSPESTRAPEHPAVQWWTNEERLPGAIAFGVATHGGVLSGVGESPSDQLGADISDDIIMTRQFMRVADLSEVDQQLREKVLDVRSYPPRPRRLDQGQAIQPYPHPHQAAAYLADVWAQTNAPLLITARQQIPQHKEERVGAGQILKQFFAFFFQSLIGAPGRWLDRMIVQTKAAIADRVSTVVFGAHAPISVIVGGVSAQGVPVNWLELNEAAGQLRTAMAHEGLAMPIPAERPLANLWTDFRSAICSMVDGSGYQRLKIRAGEYYIDNWDAIIALEDKESTFTVTTPSKFLPHGASVESWQVSRAEDLDRVMETALKHEQSSVVEREHERRELAEWRNRNFTRFIPRIGLHLAQWGNNLKAESQFYMTEIQKLSNTEVAVDMHAQQKRVARLLRIIFLLALLGVAAFLGLYFLAWIGAVLLSVFLGITFLSWLFGSAIAFYQGQRQVFALLHTRQTSDETLKVYTENLARVLDDMQAVALAHRQLDQWATLMRAFLKDPLPVEKKRTDAVRTDVVLPEGIHVEKITASQESIAEAAAKLRAGIFRQGWLTQAWEAAAEKKIAFFTPDQQQLYRDRQFPMEAESARPGDALCNWAQGAHRYGVLSQHGDRLWETCQNHIKQVGTSFMQMNLTSEGLSYEQFINGFTNAATGSVDREILTASARADNKALTPMETRFTHTSEDGLSHFMLMVDQTRSLFASDLVFSKKSMNFVVSPDVSNERGTPPPFGFDHKF